AADQAVADARASAEREVAEKIAAERVAIEKQMRERIAAERAAVEKQGETKIAALPALIRAEAQAREGKLDEARTGYIRVVNSPDASRELLTAAAIGLYRTG